MPQRLGLQYEFGPFCLDERERLLSRDGEPIPLTSKAFETLLVLVENSERLVDRSTFVSRVWPDTTVEDTTLTRNISDLRKALGDGVDGQKFIETVPKRGYRLMVAARRLDAQVVSAPITPAPAPIRPRLPWILAATALVLAGLLIGVRTTIGRQSSPIAPGSIRSIAVLPFRAIGDGTSDGVLAMGIADALVTRLSNLPEITVRPLGAITELTGTAERDPVEAGRRLRVDAVLEGSFQRLGGAARITARLLHVPNGTALWAGEFQEKSSDLFEIESVLSMRVAGALALKLSPEEARRLSHRDTANPAAQVLYMQGRHIWSRRSREDHAKSLLYFQRAIEADKSYALAYAGLGDAYLLLGDHEAARNAAKRALELDPDLGEPHATLALMAENDDHDWEKAEREYIMAIRGSPGHATPHHWYGEFLTMMGQFGAGRHELDLAAEIDPLSPIIAVDTAQAAYFERDYDRSIRILRGALEVDPTCRVAHEHIAKAYLMKGLRSEALAEARLAGNPNMSRSADIYWTILTKGRPDAALVLRKLEASPDRYPYPFELCEQWLALGDRERALDSLEKACDQHQGLIVSLKVNPELDPLRSHPRFQALLKKMRL